MEITKLYTIGFTKKSAEDFFTKLKNEGIKLLIDVRLNNSSQLAGFTKKTDRQSCFTTTGRTDKYQILFIVNKTEGIIHFTNDFLLKFGLFLKRKSIFW